MLQIYNSLSQKKEPFKPFVDGKVKMYVCGNTVYDYCHLGHARTMVAFDVIVRHLRALNYDVTYVRNITDIDDKIIKRAEENNEGYKALTERMIAAQREDESSLFLLPPDKEPKATEYIGDIIQFIEQLIAKDYAYSTDNGDVYFNIKKFKSYGKLAKKTLDELQAGHRVEVSLDKKHELDFVLWKAAKVNEPSWSSPWGKGRPGWHIECSAMANKCLGEQLDIHGGGFDLQFPHHENEIAQSEAAFDRPFVTTWMHTGFLQVNKEKMSKSLGNFFTIKHVLNDYPGEVLRYFFIASHYRSQLNYAKEHLDMAYESLKRLYQSMMGDNDFDGIKPNLQWMDEYFNAMNDDFNTPKALSTLFELSKAINKSEGKEQRSLRLTLKTLAGFLGLLNSKPNVFLTSGLSVSKEKIEALIESRNLARNEKDWKKADSIRDELASLGVEILDGPNGTTWQKK